MMNVKLTLLASLTILMSACNVPIRVSGTSARGPNKGQPIHATFYWSGGSSGKIEAIAPWGERAKGRYQTARYGAYRKNTRLMDVQSDGFTAEGDSVVLDSPNVQVGTATLLGEQGTAFDVTYSTTLDFLTTHGQGKAVDSRGNIYRLIW